MSTDISTTTSYVTDRSTPIVVSGPRAHVFFWLVLATAATVSITGNATYAVLHAQGAPTVAAAVAIVPPVALLAAVHGVTILMRAHARAHITHLLASCMTVLIAAGAFWLSFTALRALAVLAGIPEREAWLWPLIIEGSMAQATVALLALAHSPIPRVHGTAALVDESADVSTGSRVSVSVGMPCADEGYAAAGATEAVAEPAPLCQTRMRPVGLLVC
ncbi:MULTISPECIES: DUF2637 domain-containing protein [unclassified Nocardia]|uniref:DUF2637 domain-containing protein n=1 Tax=unclassified Nocardia TaxID=2637762 RepID=UPI001CE46EBF|nr:MULTISPECIES: DUF2637 domain-containing protein [unclassified Nocardia]